MNMGALVAAYNLDRLVKPRVKLHVIAAPKGGQGDFTLMGREPCLSTVWLAATCIYGGKKYGISMYVYPADMEMLDALQGLLIWYLLKSGTP